MTDELWWRGAGDRIQQLLDAVSSPGGGAAVTRERAEQLVAEVAGLYGAALQRVMALSDVDAVRRYVADDLVASLLLVHGLHPQDVHRRVSDALDDVRPYLGSHGGDVELLEVTGDLEVRLRFTGSCRSCPSSAVTLELAVEDALRAAAPEITDIQVVTETAAAGDLPTIPVESLFGSVRARGGTSWHPVPGIVDLAPGQTGGFDVGGVEVLACRIDDRYVVYRDHCPVCTGTFAGAVLQRPDPVLRCPRCHALFDVVHAGAGLDGTAAHLEPLPLLSRDGVMCVATAQPTEVSV
jgi:Fe-S cluster biogenesis protein NfuA/nitrite reductase/ring-hydroxylating ferredoxin subunit